MPYRIAAVLSAQALTRPAKFRRLETDRARIRMGIPDADAGVIQFVGGPRKGEVLSSWKRQ